MNNASTNNSTERTIVDYLSGCLAGVVIPEDAILNVLLDREIKSETLAKKVDEDDRKLLKADLIHWLLTSPSSVGGTTDKDNQWEHTDKGYGLDSSARASLKNEMNAIYKAFGEEDKMVVTTIRIKQHGIKRTNRLF